MKYVRILLLFVPVSILLHTLRADQGLLFLCACLSLIPLAALVGKATEQLALYTGSRIGGLLNATMSNVPELVIGFYAVRAGHYPLVLASMAGAIISNILLVLGVSILLGGLRYKQQIFSKSIARSNFVLLFFAAMSIVIPFALQYAVRGGQVEKAGDALIAISFCMALILLVTYISGLIFSLSTHRNIFVLREEKTEGETKPEWIPAYALAVLVTAGIFVAMMSEMLVGSIAYVIQRFGLPEVFIGIVLLPILGNVAENASAVVMAVRNKVDISIEIAIGSGIQIALFVAPVLILASFLLGAPMLYVFSLFEVVAILTAIGLSLFIFQDGKTNWLEGVVLISSYMILGVAFFFL